MKDGNCPRCDSGNVYSSKNGIGYVRGGIYVRTSTLTRLSETMDYICTDCGYFEQYVDDPGKLSHVATKWDKVP